MAGGCSIPEKQVAMTFRKTGMNSDALGKLKCARAHRKTKTNKPTARNGNHSPMWGKGGGALPSGGS